MKKSSTAACVFHTGTTLDVSFRIAALKRLQHMIRRHEKEIEAALLLDLKKSSFEVICARRVLFWMRSTICSAISAHLQKSRMSEHRWHSSAPEATENLLLTASH